MKPWIRSGIGCLLISLGLGGSVEAQNSMSGAVDQRQGDSMDLGAFSVSLSVQDLAKSRDFYQKLGFAVAGGNESENWLIMRNGDHVIGLFQGMFERNILTFNPGWSQSAENLEEFTDIRELQQQIRDGGIRLESEADAATSGPASFMVIDPDGNPILFDQHR